MGNPAPKPANFDRLTATWNDPTAFAKERAAYYEQLRSEHFGELNDMIDFSEPRRPVDR